MDGRTRRACRLLGIPLAMLWMLLPLVRPAHAQEAPRVRVARLIKDLGDGDFSTRRSAHDELSKLGPQSREQLQAAMNDADPEVRLRASRLLEELKLSELWAPGRVRIKLVDEPASKILQKLAEQTGNHVHIGDPYGNFSEKKVDVDYADCSYFQAIDDICRKTNNRIRPHYDIHTPGIVVSAGSPGQFPRAYAGPVRAQITSVRRVFIEELSYEEKRSELTHSFHVNLQFNWEDRFRIVGYATQPELVEAVTDNQAIVSSAQASGHGWNATTRGLRQVTASIKLNPVPVTAQSFATFTIRWGLIAAGEPAVLAISDLAPERVHAQDDLAVRIESLERQGGGKYQLTICVLRDLAMPEPNEIAFQEADVEMLDEKRQPFRVQNQSQALTDRGVQLKIVYHGESAESQPQSLKVHYPRVRARRDLELVFRHVPLPVNRPE